MTRVRALVVAVVLVLVVAIALAGCSSDDDDAVGAGGSATVTSTTTLAPTSTTSTTSATTAAAEPAACTPAAGYTTGTTRHRLTVGGVGRDFLVHLPPRLTTRAPLVVDFHGANSNMEQQSAYSGFDPLSDANGFVVATPNGVDAAVRQWRFLGTKDVDFANELVDELVARSCIDADRVYAAGISSGSAMSASLACQASSRFHGFGLVAGDFYAAPLCGKAQQRRIVVFHGTADTIVPYAGGKVSTSGVSVAPEEETVQHWATHNGCTAGPEATKLSSEVVRLAWSGCTQPVVLYRILGGGHTWPGSRFAVPRLGATTKQIDAAKTMWEFFAADAS
jgi:polyhydroxybutyrate depolymerase